MTREKHYNNLSLAEKEAHNRPHDVPDRCPHCGVAVQPDDLLAHVDKRCQGRAEPGPRSRWVTRKAAKAMGVADSTLDRWASSGEVRRKGIAGARRYLLRDLTKSIAARKRPPGIGEQDNAEPKSLTKAGAKAHNIDMGKPIDSALAVRIKAFAEQEGGFAAAGRRLNIPADTLRRAASGERVRRGTLVLIETQLAEAEA